MGTGRSGNGGGKRDNRNWDSMASSTGGGPRKLDGYNLYDSDEEIYEAMGLGNGGQADKWQKKLTPEEEAAVEWYTGNGHRPINELERHGPNSIGKGNSLQETMEASKNLESALDKGRLDKPIIVTRTSSPDLLGGVTSVSEIRKMAGQVVRDNGFMSAEINAATSAKNPYGTKYGNDRITYHIKTPAGKGIGQYVRGLSGAHVEQEYLFNKDASFKILGAWADASGMTHVNLRYEGRARKKK